MVEEVEKISNDLLNWMENQKYQGWDPFDALNSPFLKFFSRLNRWSGVAVLQMVKACPINLRPLLLVPKKRNAKGLGLILAALVRRYRLWTISHDLSKAIYIAEWPFDWPNRAFYAPSGTPTVVNTAFIGHALLDLYEVTGQAPWMMLAQSACDFIVNDLYRTDCGKGFCFSYTPIDRTCIHNANLLGASLLARVGKLKENPDLIRLALKSASFSIEAQHFDGSWYYGEARNQSWIDSFHTGYNLLALKYIFDASGDSNIKQSMEKGYRYYLDHFFLPDGKVKYYHIRAEPYDSHVFAHAIICLSEMSDHFDTSVNLVDKVLEQLIELFWSGRGYFYWQKKNGFMYRLPCMRWVQAWALLALMIYLIHDREKNKNKE
jgi:hypothetical protein